MRATRRRASAIASAASMSSFSCAVSSRAALRRSWISLRDCSARSTEMSSARSATSARTVTRSGSTSMNPPPTKISSRLPCASKRSGPGARVVSRGAWPGRIPSSPSPPVASTKSASPSNSEASTDTTRSENGIGSGVLLGQALALLARLLDVADHVEGLLGQVVVLALEDLQEPLHGLLDRHVAPGAPAETLGHEVGLRQETLHLAGAPDDLLVVLGELLDAEDGDDVLQLLVALHRALDALRGLVVVAPHDPGIQEARGRVQGIDGRIDADLGQRAAQG